MNWHEHPFSWRHLVFLTYITYFTSCYIVSYVKFNCYSKLAACKLAACKRASCIKKSDSAIFLFLALLCFEPKHIVRTKSFKRCKLAPIVTCLCPRISACTHERVHETISRARKLVHSNIKFVELWRPPASQTLRCSAE